MAQITKKDFADYVCGWLCICPEDPNFQNISLNNMKAALNNAFVSIDCPSDGIEAYVERQKYYAKEVDKRGNF